MLSPQTQSSVEKLKGTMNWPNKWRALHFWNKIFLEIHQMEAMSLTAQSHLLPITANEGQAY